MNKLFLIALCIAAISCDNWAILVAGSNGYWNYRHQSDIFHAYDILINHGISADKIITFAYDDIAHDYDNPFDGEIYNHPDPDIKNVYPLIDGKIDYRGDDVTPENFLKVITGEDMTGIGSGKTLQSTTDDNVFFYFSDHGGDNILCFPNDNLYADDLNNALKTMKDKGLFGKFLIYIEACESGSIFQGYQIENLGIYATTAADATESSYAYYCDDEAVVKGTNLGTCLGDEYSIRWMEDSDAVADFWQYTIGTQTDQVTQLVEGSRVQEFGDMTYRDDVIGNYQGHKPSRWSRFVGRLKEPTKKVFERKMQEKHVKVNSRDVKLNFLKNKVAKTNAKVDNDAYLKEVQMKFRTQEIFRLFREEFNLPEVRTNDNIDFDCYKKSVEYYTKLCGFDADRDAQYMTYFASFCTTKQSSWKVYHALKDICN